MKATKLLLTISLVGLMIAAAGAVSGASLSMTAETLGGPVAEESSTGPALNDGGTLRWQSCGNDISTQAECAELHVPLDYRRPRGERITIGLARLRATDPASRVGSLIFNPGGPGGVATAWVIAAGTGRSAFTAETRKHFDIIGIDPRGIGRSTRIKCDPAIWNEQVTLLPKTMAEYSMLVSHNHRLARSCAERTGRLIRFLDADNQARDMEQVRRALGDGKLNYLGISYGSFLGTTYAELFPGSIRVMAIDGILEHSLSETTMFTQEAMTFEDTLNRFIAWCDANADCALHDQGAGAIIDGLLAEAEAEPLAAPTCATSGACRAHVTHEDLRLGLQPKLFFKEPIANLGLSGWAGLAKELAEADNGDASAFSQPIARGEDDGVFAGLVIACMEFPAESRSFEELRAKMLLGRTVTPRVLGMSQTWTLVAGCIGWLPASNPPRRLDVHGAPPILLVNSTHDPSDNYIWAHGVLAQLPPNAVLLTRDGDGHSSYFLRPKSQTVAAMERYLITGQTPAPNTVLPD